MRRRTLSCTLHAHSVEYTRQSQFSHLTHSFFLSSMCALPFPAGVRSRTALNTFMLQTSLTGHHHCREKHPLSQPTWVPERRPLPEVPPLSNTPLQGETTPCLSFPWQCGATYTTDYLDQDRPNPNSRVTPTGASTTGVVSGTEQVPECI